MPPIGPSGSGPAKKSGRTSPGLPGDLVVDIGVGQVPSLEVLWQGPVPGGNVGDGLTTPVDLDLLGQRLHDPTTTPHRGVSAIADARCDWLAWGPFSQWLVSRGLTLVAASARGCRGLHDAKRSGLVGQDLAETWAYHLGATVEEIWSNLPPQVIQPQEARAMATGHLGAPPPPKVAPGCPVAITRPSPKGPLPAGTGLGHRSPVKRSSLSYGAPEAAIRTAVAILARRYNYDPVVLCSSRARAESRARQMLYYICHHDLGVSYPRIGHVLGKDHSTIVMGAAKFARQLAESPELADELATCADEVRSSISGASQARPCAPAQPSASTSLGGAVVSLHLAPEVLAKILSVLVLGPSAPSVIEMGPGITLSIGPSDG